jgi:hypothetical protein
MKVRRDPACCRLPDLSAPFADSSGDRIGDLAGWDARIYSGRAGVDPVR